MSAQIVREWPPGFGGVERVAHELATVWGGAVYSLDAQPQLRLLPDPLPVSYPRQRLPRFQVGRLLLPYPSLKLFRLLRSQEPLHGHLPSPAVLLTLLLARGIHPKRKVTAHWHCFLERSPGISGRFFGLYQRLALLLVPHLSGVVTTSPVLKQELVRCGCRSDRVAVLSCCLSDDQEQSALRIPLRQAVPGMPMHLIFIGRLDTYKRLDWLLLALSELRSPWQLVVVGDGPLRASFEALAKRLVFAADGLVSFQGRLDETAKRQCLAEAELLVLPSDRSNEAFGIVQLEAMAAGLPSLAFERSRSGMGWVGQLPGLPWSQKPGDLHAVLQRLADNTELRNRLGQQARERYQNVFARSVWLERLQALG